MEPKLRQFYSAEAFRTEPEVQNTNNMRPSRTITSESRPGTGRRKNEAFSMLEVLVAVAISAVIFAALYRGISATFGMLQTVRENLRATQIMVSRLEGVRLCAWDEGQLFSTNVVPPTFSDTFYPLGMGGNTNSGAKYYGTMTVQKNPSMSPSSSYGTNMALVTVSISWTNNNSGRKIAHTRTMSTYVAKYGIQNYVYYH
jgi:prepilin-type N-terminal cleavage/methylation domain-containing protein